MTEDELAEIPEQKLKDISEGRSVPTQVAAWKMAKWILSLIAEVRRLKSENRAMQSRLDIAEGRVEGMREENERLETKIENIYRDASMNGFDL